MVRPIPTRPDELTNLQGEFRETGHTVWPDGRAHHSGFTTAFPPQSRVIFERDGREFDIDFTTQKEGESATRTTFAAITSRSYHVDYVNVLSMDGAVRSVNRSIDPALWQAMGTRAGREFGVTDTGSAR